MYEFWHVFSKSYYNNYIFRQWSQIGYTHISSYELLTSSDFNQFVIQDRCRERGNSPSSCGLWTGGLFRLYKIIYKRLLRIISHLSSLLVFAVFI